MVNNYSETYLETGIVIVAVLLYLILLTFAVFMIVGFYVCDSENCKAFKQANKEGTRGSKEHILAILGEINNDSIWPLAFVGSSLITALGMWFIQASITIRTYIILFLTGFMIIYFLFTFVGHHYLRPIANYVSDYIETNIENVENNGEIKEEIKEIKDLKEEKFEDLICDKFI